MNLFEGLEQKPARCQNAQGLATNGKHTAVRCWCCGQGLLLLCPGDADGACIVQLSVVVTQNPADSQDHVCQLSAHVDALRQPDQLLGACATQSCSILQPAHPAGGLLALFQHQDSLKLYTLTATSTRQQPCMQLLGDFEHEGLAAVSSCSCSVLPGPTVLLQPEAWQLLVLQPAAQLSGATAPAAAAGGLHVAGARAPDSPACQLFDLPLPADALLHAVAHSFPSTLDQLVTICCNSSNGACQAGSLAAAAPWILLHSSCAQHQASDELQLLLALPVGNAGAKQQQQQQQAVLLCMLHVGLSHASNTAAGNEAMRMAWCHAMDWSAAPSSAAVFEQPNRWARGSCGAQYVAVGSQDGALKVLSCSSSSSGFGHAAARLPGAVHSMDHLPQAYLAGASHHDVLAVLHDQHAAGASSSTRQQRQAGGMAVSLLKLQHQQLQELAVVQGVLGLCAPSHAPLGLLCPQQSTDGEQQEWSRAAHTHQQGARLAAVLMLDSSMSGKPLFGEAASGLGSYAWLDADSGSLPVPLLGILAAPLGAAQDVSGMPAAADSSGLAVEAGMAGAVAGADNELNGLRSMLAVLEQRWQQDTRNLCSLQQRVVAAQRLAAAGHKQLCQMAADTLYHSSVRQHVSSVQPGAALAVYHAGQQLAAKQQHAAEQAVQGLLTTQLLLQVSNISTRLQNHHLQVQACLRPEIQSMHAPGGQAIKWCGVLLQPCHAELLLWHAGAAGVTTSSTWSWDAVSGQLTVTSLVSIDLLLQLRSLRSSKQGAAQAIDTPAQAAGAHAQAKHLQDGHAGVAHALATAAQRVAGGMASDATSSTNLGSHAADLWSTVELHAAVAVSACCSNQAVVQWEARQQPQLQMVSHRLLQRAKLLEPALALLHLGPLRVSAQDLLVYQVTGTTPGSHAGFKPAQHAASAAAQAGEQVPAQTPVRPNAAGRMVQHGRRSSMGLAAGMPEVVPPTPCSADESDGEPGVIPDSQEDDYEQQQGPHERRQELQQWWQSQQQRQLPAASPEPDKANGTAAGGAGAMDWEAIKNAGKGHEQSGHVQAESWVPSAAKSRQLLLQSATVDLQLLTTNLQRMQCFQCVRSTSQHQRLLLQAAGARQAQQGHVAGSMDQGVLDLLFLAAHALLATITAPCQHSLERMEQLLLLAVRQLPGEVMVQDSMLSPYVLGALASATQALADVTHLHVKVLEDTLQQLPASMTRLNQQHKPANSAAAPASAANLSKQLQPAVGDGEQLVVDGVCNSSMAECWVGCLKAQAHVDLAVQVLDCIS